MEKTPLVQFAVFCPVTVGILGAGFRTCPEPCHSAVNCGVGFAPCRPENRAALLNVMGGGVADIPQVVMAEGVPWKWESFPEYLDFRATREVDVDFATQVPHAPVRVHVMGQRGIERLRAFPLALGDSAGQRSLR